MPSPSRYFNDLIGGWKGTGEPEGTAAEKQRGFWKETVSFGWKFKGDDAWMTGACETGTGSGPLGAPPRPVVRGGDAAPAHGNRAEV